MLTLKILIFVKGTGLNLKVRGKLIYENSVNFMVMLQYSLGFPSFLLFYRALLTIPNVICLCTKSSVEQVLPDSLFASPTKAASDRLSDFSTSVAEANEATTFPPEKSTALPVSSASYMASQ